MRSDIQYRPATPSDARCLSALSTQVFLDTYATHGINADIAGEVTTLHSERALAARLAAPAVQLRVAECNGHLVGFIDLDAATPCPISGIAGLEVRRLYVQAPFQGQRIGHALMASAEDEARQTRRPAVWLTAWAGNHRARGFYTALGYADVGETAYVIAGVAYENRVFAKTLT